MTVVERVSAIVSKMAGIQLGPKQYSMVESRLKSRMTRLKISNLDDYWKYLVAHEHEEGQALLSLMTTHHTFFFREFNHFEYLLNSGLSLLIARARARGDKTIRIWSAAASRGQEAFSLAMFMRFHLAAIAPDVGYEIWGTDVDHDSIRWANNGVYKASELKQVPAMYAQDNWVRGTGRVENFFKAKNHLRDRCHFSTLNLFKADEFLKDRSFDLIFCRNVFIYFDTNQIKQITTTLLKHLDPEGFLILGVSESLNGLNLPASAVSASIYRHTAAAASKPAPALAPAIEKLVPKKVVCIDDSQAILGLLKKILVPSSGFEVVGTAINGRDGLAAVEKLKPDVITLDLHMPEMDGLQFLQEFKDRTIPVVVVSAINRDDTSIAQKAIALGAADYVEKPSLENLPQASNEIRSKLTMALSSLSKKTAPARQRKTRVLIVDDSATIRQLLEKILSADSEIEVVGAAERPSQVEDLIRKTSPDVITLDIHMPEMDGVTLLKKIHPKFKIPTVMISSISKEEGPLVLQALEVGAIDYIQKPEMSSISLVAPHIRERVKMAAATQVKTKISSRRKARGIRMMNEKSIVVVGASTGGTEAIREVLESMPSSVPPILVVQHIPAGFSGAFARRLNELLPFEVKEAADGDEVKSNRVLIAPGGTQMGVQTIGEKLVVRVTNDAPVNRHKPSVDYLFRSVERLGLKQVVGVLMTGMGNDGAHGLKALRSAGCRTIAQDEKTSVVFGMPREAIALGAAEAIRPLDEIATSIVEYLDEIARDKETKLKRSG